MSLALVLYNAHGLVVAADRCITTTINNNTFNRTMADRKLFLSPEGYAFTYVGNASMQGKPMSAVFVQTISLFSGQGLSLETFAHKLMSVLSASKLDKETTVYAVGFQDSVPLVLCCKTIPGEDNHSLVNEIENSDNLFCYAGEIEQIGRASCRERVS